MLSGLMVAPVTWLTNLILVNRVGGYGELGLFNAANQWRAIILFLPGLLASVMLPILSDAHGQDNTTDFTKAVALNLRATWIICLPLTILVIVLNKPLAALFGRAFSGSAPVISLLMISCFLMVVNGTVGTALIGSGRMWTGTAFNIGWAATLVAVSYLLVPSMGAQGLAAAYLAAYLLHTVWQMLYVEIKLAPSSISSQWKLILFSVMLLAAGLCSAFIAEGTFLISLLLLTLSLTPAIWFVLNSFRTKSSMVTTGGII
jgi:O-antigen/teichoic acid export membrane protein